VAVCAVVVGLLCTAHLDQMFLDGHLGYAGGLRGAIGRNYLRFDPMESRLAPLQNAGPTYDAPPSVRYNHPPLSGMLVGLSFAIFGPSEATARLIPLAGSVLTVPLLFGWVRRLWGCAGASVAVGIWAVSPFVAIYGAMVSYEPLVILWWNLLLWAWARWQGGERTRIDLIFAGCAIFLGLWTDWPLAPLVGGLIVTELVLVVTRRPRRPAMLLVAVLTLIGALGLLAIYYLVVLDVARGGLESLYRMRSSIGRWSAVDVAAHISHRTAALLTWPLVVAAVAGLIGLLLGRPKTEGALSDRGRLLLPTCLIAPPLALLVLLPQHAVIHCFSAWFLLPAAVVSAAVVLVWMTRWVSTRAGRGLAVAPLLIFGSLLIWQAVPVVADGWISDGSPLEGRPRLRYEHLAVARWAGRITEPGEILAIDPATGITGVRAWFQHDRPVLRLRGRAPVEGLLRRSRAKLALLPRERINTEDLGELIEEQGLILVAGWAALDRDRPGVVEVLELREERPSPWWVAARSASYPPHRLVRAEGRAAVYRRQILGDARPDLPRLDEASASLAELAARRMLSQSDSDSSRLEGMIRARLSQVEDREICPDLVWIGAQLGSTAAGRPTAGLVFRSERDLESFPSVSAELSRLDGGGRTSWRVNPDDLFRWSAGSWIVSSERLPPELPSGRYRLTIRGCGRSLERSAVELRHRPILPVMEPVGRI
jgi:hypothetical protein